LRWLPRRAVRLYRPHGAPVYYGRLKRVEKAVVLRFLERVSGYSRQQLTRLVKRGAQRAPLLKRYRGSRTSFASFYTVADVLLLAHTDSLHGTLSGPATKKLMERAWRLFGDPRYERLAAISVAHLYNLRQRKGYQRHRQLWTKTRPVTIPIGTRRAPTPNNRPGYLRFLSAVGVAHSRWRQHSLHLAALQAAADFAHAAVLMISNLAILPIQRKRRPHRPVHTPGLRVLGHVRQGSNCGSAWLGRGSADCLRHQSGS
jgi:hypothetical protein